MYPKTFFFKNVKTFLKYHILDKLPQINSTVYTIMFSDSFFKVTIKHKKQVNFFKNIFH